MHIITNHGMECFAAKKYNYYYGTSESIFNRVAPFDFKGLGLSSTSECIFNRVAPFDFKGLGLSSTSECIFKSL